jgi:hypothetical protein
LGAPFRGQGVGKFMADVLGIDGPESVRKIDQYTVESKLRGATPILYKILAQNYFGGSSQVFGSSVRRHETARQGSFAWSGARLISDS